MRLWTLPFRVIGIFVLAALASGAWLFRAEILRVVRPQVARVTGAAAAGGEGRPGPAALARARDKVDSLHGWNADSVLLDASEMASLLTDGLPREVRGHLDSISLTLSEGSVTVSARLETTQMPKESLGPLAGAVKPWERVSASGPVTAVRPGWAEWRVDALTLRGFTLPESASRRIVAQALPGTSNGVVPVALPKGVTGLRVHREGVALYRAVRR